VLILKRHVSKAVVTCCGLVACGFFLGIDQEKALGSLSVKGVVFGVLSSVFIALTGIYTKTALDVVNKDEVPSSLIARLRAEPNVSPPGCATRCLHPTNQFCG